MINYKGVIDMWSVWKHFFKRETPVVFTIPGIMILLSADVYLTVVGVQQRIWEYTFLGLPIVILLSLICGWLVYDRNYQMMQLFKLPFWLAVFSFVLSIFMFI